jgi:WhiB family transcriptional regulator, redox-sensing transcriptional regulator
VSAVSHRDMVRSAGAAEDAAPAHLVAELWTWQRWARCRTEDPSTFFHPDGERGRKRKHRQQRAKAVCDLCPVSKDCREHSLRFPEPFGVWGGTSEDERSTLLGRPRRRDR